MRKHYAYAIYAHGPEPGTGPDTAWLMGLWWGFFPYWLTPSEVENLWYSDYDISTGILTQVYPTDMIIHATVCYGYARNSASTAYMAKAFVDNGAAAFVGATVSIPFKDNDLFTEQFWINLCQYDKTVLTATEEYIHSHNIWISSPTWTYGTDIQIYGSTSVYLDN
ncbi:MAG: hypothetical protein ACTSP4_10020 [Candidatus Hodarchaeales archaeon]